MSAQEVIESAVAIGTLVLALVTWRMAVATRQVAETSQEQLELLRRQTSAAEAATAFTERQTVATEAVSSATERQAAATAKPRLMIDRVEGEQIVGGSDLPARWTVMLRNVGQATATVVEARVNLAPQPITLEPIPNTPIEPNQQRLFDGETSAQVLEEGDAGRLPFELSITYSGPTGYRENMQATLRGKGDRWIVIDGERHKDAGPPPRNPPPP